MSSLHFIMPAKVVREPEALMFPPGPSGFVSVDVILFSKKFQVHIHDGIRN